MDHAEALAALDAKADAERQLGAVALCPPWRHAVFAALMGALVVSPALPIDWRFVLIGATLIGVILIVQSDRRRLGVFVNGYRKGRTRALTFAMLGALLVLHTISAYYGIERHNWHIPLGLAAITTVLAYAFSVRWQQIFRAELGL